MLQKKIPVIELGGRGGYPIPPKLQIPIPKSINTTQRCELDRTDTICSKDMIASTHKISQKLSPTKRKMLPHQTPRNDSLLDNESGFIELQNSGISMVNKSIVCGKSPLLDRSNIQSPNSQSRQFVRINFVNNSPVGSKTSSTHLRQFKPSPTKMVVCSKEMQQSREIELERKVKVLESRIGQIHKEKHEAVGRLNEENRKVYHENTCLKRKITELTNCLEQNSEENSVKCERIDETTKNSDVEEISIENEAMKRKLEQYETIISEEIQKNTILVNKCNDLQKAYLVSKAEAQTDTQQLLQLRQTIKQMNQENNELQLRIETIQTEFKRQRITFEQDLTTIKTAMTENNERNIEIITEYESKLEEYRNAYNQNQGVIEELSQTITYLQTQIEQTCQPNHNITEEQYLNAIIEEEVKADMDSDCKRLENNFANALDDRDKQIQQLQGKVESLAQELEEKFKECECLLTENEQKLGQLQKCSEMLEKYSNKIQEMEIKYSQLSTRYECQQQRIAKAEHSSQKCKKCEQLMKTIFRLNSHLNKRTI